MIVGVEVSSEGSLLPSPTLRILVGDQANNSIIESLGVYLPPRIVSTAEVMRGCTRPISLQLERLTGIRNRRVAGDDTFSIDLAKRAIEKCLTISKYHPSDIDLLICCNMSRYDGPDFYYTVEPSTSTRLRKHFGFNRALSFDVGNACAGMFTAIKVADALLKTGLIDVAMVVSGEYITHLTQTAQYEMTDSPDPRLACLTLGDSGAALILERASDDGVGFHAIDLYTAGAYCDYSIAKPTDQEHGGAIMFTDSRRLHEVAIRHSAAHIVQTLKNIQWGKNALDHVIIHQTSERFFYEAASQVNALVQEPYCHDGNMLDNLAERGNTATTTHFLAVWDFILNNKIQAGDNVVFAIQASGLTIGTAAYTFDDLPDRIRDAESRSGAGSGAESTHPPACRRAIAPRTAWTRQPRIRLESLGVAAETPNAFKDGLDLIHTAMDCCLAQSSYQREDIALLIYTGVHRNDFLGEPAIAAMIANRAKLNEAGVAASGKKIFAFDIFNSSIGFLQACYAGVGLIRSHAYPMAMVVASEIENNRGVPGKDLLGIAEVGSAVILDTSPSTDAAVGFGNFVFRTFDDYLGTFSSSLVQSGGQTSLRFARHGDLETAYLECISPTVEDLLTKEGLRIEDIKVILPPQISASFVPRLRDAMFGSNARFVDLARDHNDLHSSTLPYTLRHVREQGWVEKGDIGLIINVGSGIQVGCATYYF